MHGSSSAPLQSPISKQADRPCAGAGASPCLSLGAFCTSAPFQTHASSGHPHPRAPAQPAARPRCAATGCFPALGARGSNSSAPLRSRCSAAGPRGCGSCSVTSSSRPWPASVGRSNPAAPPHTQHAAALEPLPHAAQSADAAALGRSRQRGSGHRAHGRRRQRQHTPAEGQDRDAAPAADVLPAAGADRRAAAARAGRRGHRPGQEDAPGARSTCRGVQRSAEECRPGSAVLRSGAHCSSLVWPPWVEAPRLPGSCLLRCALGTRRRAARRPVAGCGAVVRPGRGSRLCGVAPPGPRGLHLTRAVPTMTPQAPEGAVRGGAIFPHHMHDQLQRKQAGYTHHARTKYGTAAHHRL